MASTLSKVAVYTCAAAVAVFLAAKQYSRKAAAQRQAKEEAKAKETEAVDVTLTLESHEPDHCHAYRPVVFCGPSGVGKGTLINMLLTDFPGQFCKSVSHTTRAKRDGEVDGTHYHFTSVDEMQKQIGEGLFIEHACVHGNYYGTSVAAVKAVSSSFKIPLLELDIQGVQNVYHMEDISALFFFVLPPSVEVLEQRLRSRGSESEDSIQRRLQTAAFELGKAKETENLFDLLLTNDDLNQTYAALRQHLVKHFPHLQQFGVSKFEDSDNI